ncbi:hypothetical protein SprV_0401663600 [Sparganum proliferum]
MQHAFPAAFLFWPTTSTSSSKDLGSLATTKPLVGNREHEQFILPHLYGLPTVLTFAITDSAYCVRDRPAHKCSPCTAFGWRQTLAKGEARKSQASQTRNANPEPLPACLRRQRTFCARVGHLRTHCGNSPTTPTAASATALIFTPATTTTSFTTATSPPMTILPMPHPPPPLSITATTIILSTTSAATTTRATGSPTPDTSENAPDAS